MSAARDNFTSIDHWCMIKPFSNSYHLYPSSSLPNHSSPIIKPIEAPAHDFMNGAMAPAVAPNKTPTRRAHGLHGRRMAGVLGLASQAACNAWVWPRLRCTVCCPQWPSAAPSWRSWRERWARAMATGAEDGRNGAMNESRWGKMRQDGSRWVKMRQGWWLRRWIMVVSNDEIDQDGSYMLWVMGCLWLMCQITIISIQWQRIMGWYIDSGKYG